MLGLQSINLLDISPDAIERTCKVEFTEDPDFILDFSSATNKNILTFIKSIKKLTTSQNVWTLLSDEGVTCKTFQAWIYYILHHGLENAASFEEKERALLAAQLYYVLMIQPGSDGSQFYHSVIYEKSLSLFKIVANINFKSKERKSKTARDQEVDEEEIALTIDQQVSLLDLFTEVLKDFCRLLPIFSLKNRPNELKQTVEALILVVKSFAVSIKSSERNTPYSESDLFMTVLPDQLALKGLRLLINLKHGKIEEVSTLVFRLLMTTITMRHSTTSSYIPRAAVQQAQASMDWVTSVCAEHRDDTARPIRMLMQNIIAQCPERMENRNHVASFVSSFITTMPISWYADFVGWLKRFANHARIGYRIGSLSVINHLLLKPERSITENDELSEDAKIALTHKCLLEAVILAISDAAPTVRSKSITILADVLEKASVSPAVFAELLQSSFICASPSISKVQRASSLATPLPGITPLILNSVPAPSVCVFDPTGNNLLSLFLKCSLEEKYVVRKSAVMAVGAAICNGFIAATKQSLDILEQRCCDPLLSVRKCAVQAISKVLTIYPDNINVQKVWISCVLPSISDAESSLQEKASQVIEEKILTNLLDEDNDLPWKLLLFLTTDKGNRNRVYLQKVAKEWNNQGKLKKNILEKIVKSLPCEKRKGLQITFQPYPDIMTEYRQFLSDKTKNQSVKIISRQISCCGLWTRTALAEAAHRILQDELGMDHSSVWKLIEAWMLLSILTLYTGDNKIAVKIIHSWNEETQVKNPMNMQIDMVSTAGQVAKFMNNADKETVLESLKARVDSGKCSIQLIGYMFEAIYKLIDSQRTDHIQTKAAMDAWCKTLLSSRDTWFSEVVIMPSQAGYDEDLLINHIYVVGEAAQRCSENVPKRLLLSIQALLTNPSKDPDFQALSQPLSQFGDAGVPSSIRAHAIFNLGRISFQNEILAKKLVPALSRELSTCHHEEVRNNALVILTDLCILQTQLVDPFLQDMANCLGDESVTIRKHAIILLSSLLQKEYVKWKEALLFKFLYVACDKCEEVRSLARFFLLKQLLRGSMIAGNLFYRNFVACLFYFNAYDGHNLYKFTSGNTAAAERERKLFDLKDNFERRMEIYEFVLQNMEDSHRINLTGKLCTDVLEAFVEGTIPLKKQTQNLLTDALSVLCCKDIRLRCLRTRQDEDLEDLDANNPDEQLRVVQNVAKHKIILQTVKTNLVENIIPIIITLKNMLFDMKSPLIKNVMLYLKEVMKEYRKEVQVILSADKQLASEIEFDLKRFDAEQEEAEKAVVLQKIPVVMDPTPQTPIATSQPCSPQVFATPATLKRKSRPMNVQAILHSAKKALNSPRPTTSKHVEIEVSPPEATPAFVPATPVHSNTVDQRAASTPQTSMDFNVTFARDISAIAPPSGCSRLVLLSHPEKTPAPSTWNVMSPARPITRRPRKKITS